MIIARSVTWTNGNNQFRVAIETKPPCPGSVYVSASVVVEMHGQTHTLSVHDAAMLGAQIRLLVGDK